MGNCMEPVKFVPEELIPGQDSASVAVFKILMLDEHDIDQLYKAFLDIDVRHIHYIKWLDLQIYFHIEDTVFNRKLFSLFNTDNGELTFLQFVCSVWNFLSMKTEDLARYAFHMYCDRYNELNIIGLKEILEVIHGKDYMNKNKIRMLISHFENDIPHARVEDFVVFSRKYVTLTDPVKRLQLVLRQTLIGEKFWRAIAEKRYNMPDMIRKNYVLNVSKDAVLASAGKKKFGNRTAKPRRSKSNKYAVAMHQLSKVIPVKDIPGDTSPDREEKRAPKTPFEMLNPGVNLEDADRNRIQNAKWNPDEVMVTVTSSNISPPSEDKSGEEWKVAAKLHPHVSRNNADNSPRKSSDGSNHSPRRTGALDNSSPRKHSIGSLDNSPRHAGQDNQDRSTYGSGGSANAPRRRIMVKPTDELPSAIRQSGSPYRANK